MKLIDIPEMNYKFDENRSGEICLKGPNIFMGYYKNEESTLKLFDQDNWLHTGDIGKLNDVIFNFNL